MGHRTHGCCMGIRQIRDDIHARFAAINQRATEQALAMMDDEDDAEGYRVATGDVHAILKDDGEWWYRRRPY